MTAAGYPAVVDRDGVSPELRNDIEELNRRRGDIAVGWATVEAQNRRRRRVYGLVGTGTVGWLNRYWAAPSSTGEYYAGPLHCGAAGYPVMVDFEPDGLSDEGLMYPPRVAVYVAAVPAPEPTAAPSDRAGQLRAFISDAGFTVDIEPDAGLVARATPPTVEALRRGPAGLGNLGPLIGDLAALAAAEGVVPAPAD